MTSHPNVVKDEEREAVFFSLALDKAQFGSHKYIVLVICGLIILSISAPGSSLVEARNLLTCNLAIDYDQQIKINTYTLIALISGGLIIAIPSDSSSRLKPLVVSLILYGLATTALGFCSEYYCYASLSVFRAFWASALLAVTVVYVAEIQTPGYRGPGLCCLQIFWLIGIVVMPVLSIPWRVSQFIFGALALAVAILVPIFFAESPRLLLSLGKNETAVKSLRKIYTSNCPNREKEYPVKTLVDDFSPEAQINVEFRTYVPKSAVRPPWYCLLIVLQIQFVFNLCYFTMSYWFREINCRHVLVFPIKPMHEAECNLGEKYLPARREIDSDSTALQFNSFCKSVDIDADYYKEVLIVAITTLPILIWMILRIDYLGRSFFTTLSHAIAGLLSFCVHFMIGTKHGLFYTCFMESMWIVSATASSCLVTEIFTTRVRVLGVGLANGFGHMGMTMGIYGLLNGVSGCIFVMSFTGILLTTAGLLTLALPDIVGVHLK